MKTAIIICLVWNAVSLAVVGRRARIAIRINNGDLETATGKDKAEMVLNSLWSFFMFALEIVVMIAAYSISQGVFWILLGMLVFSVAFAKPLAKSYVALVAVSVLFSAVGFACYYMLLQKIGG